MWMFLGRFAFWLSALTERTPLWCDILIMRESTGLNPVSSDRILLLSLLMETW